MRLKSSIFFFKKKKEDVNITSLKLLIDIERVGTGCKNESFKFVGVYLDENLNWNYHLKSVKHKTSSAVFVISSVKNILRHKIKFIILLGYFEIDSFIPYFTSFITFSFLIFVNVYCYTIELIQNLIVYQGNINNKYLLSLLIL